MWYNSLLRKIILIIGDIFCLYLATSIAMALELGNKQTDKIAFHLEFLPILVIMMFFMFNVYGLFSLIRKKLVDIFLNLLVAVTNIYIMAMAMTFFFFASLIIHVLYLFIQQCFRLYCWQSDNISVTSGNGSTFQSRRQYCLQPVKKQHVSKINLPKLMAWSRRCSLFAMAVNRATGSSISTPTTMFLLARSC